MADPASFVKEQINKHRIVIFSKSKCPFCKMAKQVFDKLNEKYEAIELDKIGGADAIQDVLFELTDARTVPRVFVNGKCIGGGTDVKKMFETNELQKLLAQ